MNVFILYMILLKATITGFAGLASLPVVRDELVIQHHLLTDKQLNEAVVITQSSPGPVGLYVVSAGYFAAGLPGALAGWLAMITPALLIIPLIRFASHKAEHPRVKAALQAVVVASASLLMAAAIPLAKDALVDSVTVTIAIASLALLLKTHLGTPWIILGAAAVSVLATFLPLLNVG